MAVTPGDGAGSKAFKKAVVERQPRERHESPCCCGVSYPGTARKGIEPGTIAPHHRRLGVAFAEDHRLRLHW
jgi:hypothetical protein